MKLVVQVEGEKKKEGKENSVKGLDCKGSRVEKKCIKTNRGATCHER